MIDHLLQQYHLADLVIQQRVKELALRHLPAEQHDLEISRIHQEAILHYREIAKRVLELAEKRAS